MDAAFFHFSLFIIFFFSQMSELKAQKHGKTVQTTIRYETKTPIGRISMARDDARFSEIQNGGRLLSKGFKRMSNSVTEASYYTVGIELLRKKIMKIFSNNEILMRPLKNQCGRVTVN